MRKNVLKMGLPIGVVVLAVAGAFANNVSSADKSTSVDVNGRLPESCQETEVQCSTIPNVQMCTASGQQLYRLNAEGTDCPEELFKKIQ